MTQGKLNEAKRSTQVRKTFTHIYIPGCDIKFDALLRPERGKVSNQALLTASEAEEIAKGLRNFSVDEVCIPYCIPLTPCSMVKSVHTFNSMSFTAKEHCSCNWTAWY